LRTFAGIGWYPGLRRPTAASRSRPTPLPRAASRKPDDIPAFSRAFIEALRAGRK
jgi:hypothetical protein